MNYVTPKLAEDGISFNQLL